MDPKIKEFIDKEILGVFSINLSDGAPHGATVHFSYSENPFVFYIMTENTTLKAQTLLKNEIQKASLVIGFSEKVWITLQMRGNVKIVTDEKELEETGKVHFGKFPKSENYKSPQTVFLKFKPHWYRFTDFNTEPETIIEK